MISSAKRIQGVENLHENRQYCRTWPKRFLLLSTFLVSVLLIVFRNKTYDRPHCHPHLRKIVKKPWCISCEIVFIFESRTYGAKVIHCLWRSEYIATYQHHTPKKLGEPPITQKVAGSRRAPEIWINLDAIISSIIHIPKALGICIWNLLAGG